MHELLILALFPCQYNLMLCGSACCQDKRGTMGTALFWCACVVVCCWCLITDRIVCRDMCATYIHNTTPRSGVLASGIDQQVNDV